MVFSLPFFFGVIYGHKLKEKYEEHKSYILQLTLDIIHVCIRYFILLYQASESVIAV